MAVDAAPAVDELADPIPEPPENGPALEESADADSHDVGHRAWPGTGIVATIAGGLAALAVLLGSCGFLGHRVYQSRQIDQQRQLFLSVARQGALNLTTIDHTEADADVQRILDSATGAFREDFQRRSAPFVDVVKKAQSTSEGTITEAGLESQEGDQAAVLVAVTVKTSLAGAPEPEPRAWRMRMTVQRVEDAVKIANVEFVP